MARVLWFRRDLRLHDNPALVAAAEGSATDGDGIVVPLVTIDTAQWRYFSEPLRNYVVASMRELDATLDGKQHSGTVAEIGGAVATAGAQAHTIVPVTGVAAGIPVSERWAKRDAEREKQVPVSEDVENIFAGLIGKIIFNEPVETGVIAMPPSVVIHFFFIRSIKIFHAPP